MYRSHALLVSHKCRFVHEGIHGIFSPVVMTFSYHEKIIEIVIFCKFSFYKILNLRNSRILNFPGKEVPIFSEILIEKKNQIIRRNKTMHIINLWLICKKTYTYSFIHMIFTMICIWYAVLCNFFEILSHSTSLVLNNLPKEKS